MEVSVSIRSDDQTLPLFIKPKDGRNSLSFLKTWIASNKHWLDDKLLGNMVRVGAILFQGFDVNEGREFEEIVQQYDPELSDEYRGTSPRKLVPGTQYVFTASELPPYFPIPQHLEMSFLPAPPRKLFFCCLQAPTSAGGETCLCDFRKVYQSMDPNIRLRFEDKGMMYTRNYNGQKTFLTDPTMLKGWQDVFGTSSKNEVEEELHRTKLSFSWLKGDRLRITNKEAAVEPHPVTGDKVWFNHVALFHWSMIPDEYRRIYHRLGQVKYWFLSWIMWILKLFFLNFLGPKYVGFHSRFGDESEIPESDISHVRDVIWSNMVFNRWQKGDILMIDNFRVSHGRQPYSGKRKIVVAWSKPYLKPSHQTE